MMNISKTIWFVELAKYWSNDWSSSKKWSARIRAQQAGGRSYNDVGPSRLVPEEAAANPAFSLVGFIEIAVFQVR